MPNTLIIILIAIVVVALFVVGLSITIMRKGHNIESDVGSNRHMRAMGLECASAQIRREEAERLGHEAPESGLCNSLCDGCSVDRSCSEES